MRLEIHNRDCYSLHNYCRAVHHVLVQNDAPSLEHLSTACAVRNAVRMKEVDERYHPGWLIRSSVRNPIINLAFMDESYHPLTVSLVMNLVLDIPH